MVGVNIIKDTIDPIIIINSPSEGERFGKNAPLFNVTVTEVNKSIPSGLNPGVIILIVVVSVVSGVTIPAIVYIFIKKRKTTV